MGGQIVAGRPDGKERSLENPAQCHVCGFGDADRHAIRRKISPEMHRSRKPRVVFQAIQQRFHRFVTASDQRLYDRIARKLNATRLTVLPGGYLIQIGHQRGNPRRLAGKRVLPLLDRIGPGRLFDPPLRIFNQCRQYIEVVAIMSVFRIDLARCTLLLERLVQRGDGLRRRVNSGDRPPAYGRRWRDQHAHINSAESST